MKDITIKYNLFQIIFKFNEYDKRIQNDQHETNLHFCS